MAEVETAFVRETGWEIVTAGWTDAEATQIEELVAEKYAQPAWNEKR